MAKPFFFRIDAADLINFATDPEGEGMSLLRFAKELQRGESEIAFIQTIIEEANGYIEKKRKAGAKGGKAKASTAKAEPSTAKAEPSTPLASNSNSNKTTKAEEAEEPASSKIKSFEDVESKFSDRLSETQIIDARNKWEISRANKKMIDPFLDYYRWLQRESSSIKNQEKTCVGSVSGNPEAQAAAEAKYKEWGV